MVADTIGQASLAFSCASIAYATFSPIAGSVTDCVHQDRRKYMINIALYVCGISSNTIRDYQRRFQHRKVAAVCQPAPRSPTLRRYARQMCKFLIDLIDPNLP